MTSRNTKRIFIGIDPGISGAVVAIGADLRVLALGDTPTLKTGGKTLYDVAEMAALLRRFCLMGEALVVLETAQPMPKQGVTSTFSTGFGYGLWCGILSALEISYRTVKPSVWTRDVLKGCSGEGKERSVAFIMQMFPGVELVLPGCKKPRDGRADALALAYWGVKS